MLHSLSWGLREYYKEREKNKEKLTSLYHLFHRSSHIYLSIPFSSSSVCLLSFPSPFLLCMLQLIVWTPNALMAFSQRAQISAALEENGTWWRWGVEIFQTQLSHALPPSASPFFSIQPSSFLSSLHATVITGVVVACEDRGWGAETIDRVSIRSGEMLQYCVSKASERPRFCCTLPRALLW